MIMHIGNNKVVCSENIIAIFSVSLLDQKTFKEENYSQNLAALFSSGNNDKKEAAYKSVILMDGDAPLTLSPVSALTLRRRAGDK